jgi:NADH:ubiquinone oxidoreductase subunit 5 (subunit L)/multisubunit Na+/H+ antiporter MnhA subunit
MTSPENGSSGGDSGPRVHPLAVVAVVIVLLLLAAVATPEAFIWLRHTGVAKVVLPDTPVLANYLLVALSLSFVIAALIIRILMVGKRRSVQRPQKTAWWATLLRFGLLLLLVRLAISSGLLRRRLGDLTRRFSAPSPTVTSAPSPTAAVPHVTSRPLGIALTVALALILALAIAGIVFLLARVKGEIAPPELEDSLAGVLEGGIDDLHRIRDPRRAVIACYARMERLMSSSGTPRLLADTPTEFLARVLQRRAVSAASVSQLTALFERARFSPHEVDEQMREEALAALEQVRSELALV